jgi:fructose-1-phosphate kinase PfkB-like protein
MKGGQQNSDARLVAVGGITLDLLGRMNAAFLSTKADDQAYTTWALKVGGTATNIARIATELNIQTTLLGVVGEDRLGQFVTAILSENASFDLVPIRVTGVQTGVVVLLFLQKEEIASTRKMIGPTPSPLDKVDFEVLANSLEAMDQIGTLIIDGYFCRTRCNDFPRLIEAGRRQGARLCIELVPHDIWKYVDANNTMKHIMRVDHLSCGISTLEHLVGLCPAETDDARGRARRIVDRLHRESPSPILHLRYGTHDSEAQAVIIDPNTQSYSIRTYDLSQYVTTQSLGDRFFLEELYPTLKGAFVWETL